MAYRAIFLSCILSMLFSYNLSGMDKTTAKTQTNNVESSIGTDLFSSDSRRLRNSRNSSLRVFNTRFHRNLRRSSCALRLHSNKNDKSEKTGKRRSKSAPKRPVNRKKFNTTAQRKRKRKKNKYLHDQHQQSDDKQFEDPRVRLAQLIIPTKYFKNQRTVQKIVKSFSKDELEKPINQDPGYYVGHYAAMYGDEDILKQLSRKRVNINLTSKQDGNTAFHVVHSKEIAEFMVNIFAFTNYNIKNKNEEFPHQTLRKRAAEEIENSKRKERILGASAYLKQLTETIG